MLFGKFLLRTLIGLVVTVVVGTLIGGQEFLQAVMLFVVCTLGIAVIIASPVLYAIGLLCSFWWLPFGKRKVVPPPMPAGSPATGPPPLTVQRIALLRYLESASNKGLPEEAVRAQCRLAGWPDEEVAVAWQSLRSPAGERPG